MRIISYNVNGVRAAINKGLVDWLATHPADVVCLQEIKACQADVDCTGLEALGYEHYWFPAQKKGYSGVAIFSRTKPDYVAYGSQIVQSDFEGRVIRADFGDISIFSAYFPSGTAGDERQMYKMQWLDEFHQYLENLRFTKQQLVVCGDYNIAHTELDIHDPKGNKKNSGFLPEEREWLGRFLKSGYIDTFRHMHPHQPHHYSWWSQRFPSVRLQNKGWRIDYICVTENLKDRIKDAQILPDIKHSDHCPVYVELSN